MYPRATDPIAGVQTSINSFTTDTISINIGVGGGAGTGADISAVVGAGGTLIFTVNDGGSNYVNAAALPPEPNGENMPIVGISRIGLGNTTTTGVGASISVQVLGVSTATGIGSHSLKSKNLNSVRRVMDSSVVINLLLLVFLQIRMLAMTSKNSVEVVSVFTDQIASWQFGNIDYIDSIKSSKMVAKEIPTLL